MFATVNELNRNINPLSELISDNIMKLLNVFNSEYKIKKERISYEDARLYQKTEYPHETVEYVYQLLNGVK